MVPLIKTPSHLREKALLLTRPLFDRLSLGGVAAIAKALGLQGDVLSEEDRNEVWWNIEKQKAQAKTVPVPVKLPGLASEQPAEQEPSEAPAEPESAGGLQEELEREREENRIRKEIQKLKEENKKLQLNQKRRERRRAKKASFDPFSEYANGKFEGIVRVTKGGEKKEGRFDFPHEAAQYARSQVGLVTKVELEMRWENRAKNTWAKVLFVSFNDGPMLKTFEDWGEFGKDGMGKVSLRHKIAARSLWDDDETIIPDAGKPGAKKPLDFAEEAARLQGLSKEKTIERKPGPKSETKFSPVEITTEVPAGPDSDKIRAEALRAANEAGGRLKHNAPEAKQIWLMTHVPGWYEGSVPLVRPVEQPEQGFFASAPHLDITSEQQYRDHWLEPFKARLVELGYEVEERSGKGVDKWAAAMTKNATERSLKDLLKRRNNIQFVDEMSEDSSEAKRLMDRLALSGEDDLSARALAHAYLAEVFDENTEKLVDSGPGTKSKLAVELQNRGIILHHGGDGVLRPYAKAVGPPFNGWLYWHENDAFADKPRRLLSPEEAERLRQDVEKSARFVPMMKAAKKRKYERNYKEKKTTPAGNVIRIYDEKHIKQRQKKKEKKLKFLEKNIGKLRKQVKQDLKSDDAKTRATAALVSLIDFTAIRVGNPDSADDFETFGATTLEKRHARVSGGKIKFNFVGKKNVDQSLVLDDAATVKEIKALLDGKKKNDLIFEYDDGKNISAKVVNRYLAAMDLTAKDLRAARANDIMNKYLKKHDWDEALDLTAEDVGHQASTLEKNYLSQRLVEKHKPEKPDKKDKDGKPKRKKSWFDVPLMKIAAPDESDEEFAEESGPFCSHWSDPRICDRLCECGHEHKDHFDAAAFDYSETNCQIDGCDCERFEDAETTAEAQLRAVEEWRRVNKKAQIKSARWSFSDEQLKRQLALEAAVDQILGPSPTAAKAKQVAPMIPHKSDQPDQTKRPGKPPISSDYGNRRNPTDKSKIQFHRGLDVKVPTGTPVLAIDDGVVMSGRFGPGWQDPTNRRKGFGRRIYIKHPSGHVSIYAHLSKIEVSEGQQVSKGQQIGLSGASGNATYADGTQHPHIHLEVKDPEGKHVDPEAIIYGKEGS